MLRASTSPLIRLAKRRFCSSASSRCPKILSEIGSGRFGKCFLPAFPCLFPKRVYRPGDAGERRKGFKIEGVGRLVLSFAVVFALMQFAPPRDDAL